MEAAKYVAIACADLCRKSIGRKLPIIYLTIFAHYPDEYENLVSMLGRLGKTQAANNGFRVALRKPIETNVHIIAHLRIRKPDP